MKKSLLCVYSYLLVGSTFAHAVFVWPDKITERDLPALADSYAKHVTHVLLEDPKTPAEGRWARERLVKCWGGYEDIKARVVQNLPKSLDELLDARTRLCKEVKEGLVLNHIDGQQFGNCSEGAAVMYCLAHQAGFKDLMVCDSKNDHLYAAYLKPGAKDLNSGKVTEPQICVMDRFGGVFGNFFCGAYFKKNKMRREGVKKSEHEQAYWYTKLKCGDTFVYPDKDQMRELVKHSGLPKDQVDQIRAKYNEHKNYLDDHGAFDAMAWESRSLGIHGWQDQESGSETMPESDLDELLSERSKGTPN